jgi:ankyrin repeat protein
MHAVDGCERIPKYCRSLEKLPGVPVITQEVKMNSQELFNAIELNNHSKVSTLLDEGADANGKNHMDQTPLMRAVIFGAYECAKVLIEKGAKVGAKQIANDSTALHDVAAEALGTAKMAKLLIQAGADVNAKTSGGYTPLLVAAGRGKTEVVKVLLEAGADVHATGESGYTALLLAQSRGYLETARLIKNYSVKK